MGRTNYRDFRKIIDLKMFKKKKNKYGTEPGGLSKFQFYKLDFFFFFLETNGCYTWFITPIPICLTGLKISRY